MSQRPEMPDAVSCPACGAAAAAGQRFCGECGTVLQRRCPSCQTENPPGFRFCGSCGAPFEQAPPPRPAEQPHAAAPLRDERRWVTVVFADVSGFTAMSERMDPEEVKALANHCAERLSHEVRRFGGTVINVVGDEVVAVFGAPLAHEDDAERAVRAALAMRDSVLSDDPAQPITVHVGINTGEVMAGLLGPEERRDYTVMGDTVNTAARLLSAAPAGSVLVGEQTYRATAQVVRYRELPPISAKGKDRPVQAWEALAVAELPAQRPLGTAPLVGRDEELARLLAMWQRVARDAQPHLLTILGEPGIGKSRLAAEFEQHLLSQARLLHGRCLPYGEALGYSALAMVLKEAAGISAEDAPAVARARLAELVSRLFEPELQELDPAEIGRHLALLSGLDMAEDRLTSTGDQAALYLSVRRFFEAYARHQPTCLIIDDIHWADDALLDLLEHVAGRVRDVPLLLVTQARPELLEKRPTWGRGVRSFTSLPLSPLDKAQEQELLLTLCKEHGLSESMALQLGEGPGGNPLFAEELIAMIAEHGQVAGVPSLIKLLIQARLDGLPPGERRVIQLASVIGRVFWDHGLQALGAGTPNELGQLLEILEQKDLLRAQPRSLLPGSREFVFKHDLIRDVAYETLPRAERRVLHGRVADWLAQGADERAGSYLDLLTYHAVEARQIERAVAYLVRAAERASRAAAHRQAAALLGQALTLAEGREQALLADLHARRGQALMQATLWNEASAELEAALALCGPEALEQRVQLLTQLAFARYWLLDVAKVQEYGAQALSLAQQMGRQDLAASALISFALRSSANGDLAASEQFYNQAFAASSNINSSALLLGMVQQTMMFYWTGRPDRALARAQEAVDLAQGLSDATSTMLNLPHIGLALAASGRYAEALQAFEHARRFGTEHELWAPLARSIAVSAGVHLDLYDYAGNQALAEEARELGRSTKFLPAVISAGIDLLLNYARRQEPEATAALLEEVAQVAVQATGFHGWLWRLRLLQARAELALACGEHDAALPLLDEALAQSRARGRVKYEALGLWARANAFAATGRTRKAVADLQRGLKLARRTSDPALFLRVAGALLALDQQPALADEAQSTVARIRAALPTEELRRCFDVGQPLTRLGL